MAAVTSESDDLDIAVENVMVKKVSTSELRSGEAKTFVNDDDETVRYFNADANYLVNTSGAIQKNKTAAKDGDDWYFYVEDRQVKLYTNNKNLDDRSKDGSQDWEDYVTKAEDAE